MRISTKGRYATRAMLDLAMHGQRKPLTLREVAGRQEVSVQYLEQIFNRLKGAGLVNGTRGAQGGFVLARPPSDISVGEIVQAMEGPLAPVHCIDNPGTCQRAAFCAVRDVWTEMGAAMMGVLGSTNLQHLADRQMSKDQTRPVSVQSGEQIAGGAVKSGRA
jgi:Rrf2 family protein